MRTARTLTLGVVALALTGLTASAQQTPPPPPRPMPMMQGPQQPMGPRGRMEQMQERCQAFQTQLQEIAKGLDAAKTSKDPAARADAALAAVSELVAAMQQMHAGCPWAQAPMGRPGMGMGLGTMQRGPRGGAMQPMAPATPPPAPPTD